MFKELFMETKCCKNCEQEKSIDEYYIHYQKGKNGQKWKYFDSYCKKCRIEYCKERVLNTKQKAIEYLGGKCVDCGLFDDPCVYDFHHLNPNEKEISFGKNKSLSFDKIKSELDKCVLLCSNCHRKRHYNSII